MNQHIQFGVVREDPLIEKRIIEKTSSKNILIIASGGCTALSLEAWFPDLRMTLLDPNPAQLKLIQHKIKALRIKSPQKKIAAFNKLIESGNFEKLFRGFRNFIGDFIWDYDHWKRWFKKPQQSKLQNEVFSHPYWPVAFELYFSDALLNTMFGPE